ncbi:MAG: hypothetical protein K6E54_10795 [Bacteroidaceae bacterium]|nr:hypothetical protein [Bacteroidaceae bacterium]
MKSVIILDNASQGDAEEICRGVCEYAALAMTFQLRETNSSTSFVVSCFEKNKNVQEYSEFISDFLAVVCDFNNTKHTAVQVRGYIDGSLVSGDVAISGDLCVFFDWASYKPFFVDSQNRQFVEDYDMEKTLDENDGAVSHLCLMPAKDLYDKMYQPDFDETELDRCVEIKSFDTSHFETPEVTMPINKSRFRTSLIYALFLLILLLLYFLF